MDEVPEDEAKTPLGCLLAIAIGALVAVGTEVAFSVLTGRSLQGWGFIASNAFLVAIPFIAVALTGTLRKAPWLVGLALTALLWGYYLCDGVSYQWHPDGSGANIGLGLLMLASPLFITAACLGVHWLQRLDRR